MAESKNAVVEILKSESQKIKKHGHFNFLLSDGKFLFAYGDDSLYFTTRKTPFKEVTLRDDLYTFNLREIKAPDEKAILVATEPLTVDERWTKLKGIKVFRHGEEV